jgi:uncharacterized protein with HEPN domain
LNKNFKTDITRLKKILEHQQDIKETVELFQCDFSQSSKSLCNNKKAFDLCSFYMVQIYELSKGLSSSTKEELSKVINLEVLRMFRNRISHQYDKINKVYLQSYIQQMCGKDAINMMKNRYLYCQQNKNEK